MNLILTRPYSANLGKWLSRDPIEEAGGDNLYSYVMNNPVNFRDPWGLDPWPFPGPYPWWFPKTCPIHRPTLPIQFGTPFWGENGPQIPVYGWWTPFAIPPGEPGNNPPMPPPNAGGGGGNPPVDFGGNPTLPAPAPNFPIGGVGIKA